MRMKKSAKRNIISILAIILSLSVGILALEAVDVVNEALANISKFETVSLELKVETGQGLGGTMVMSVKSHLKEEVGRLEFISPKELAGQIIIVDKPKDQFINYYPTGQAVRMPLANAQAAGTGFDVSSLMELNVANLDELDLDRFVLGLDENTLDGVPAYVISVMDTKNEVGLQKIWLRKADKFPIYMESYDLGGNRIMTMTLDKVEINKGLDLASLRALPKTAVIFDM